MCGPFASDASRYRAADSTGSDEAQGRQALAKFFSQAAVKALMLSGAYQHSWKSHRNLSSQQPWYGDWNAGAISVTSTVNSSAKLFISQVFRELWAFKISRIIARLDRFCVAWARHENPTRRRNRFFCLNFSAKARRTSEHMTCNDLDTYTKSSQSIPQSTR